MHKEIKYYVNGHTADGFVDFLASNLVDIDRKIILKHPSNRVKTEVLNKLAVHYRNDYDIEMISSPNNEKYIDGIIVRDLSLAVLSETEYRAAVKGDNVLDLTKYVSTRIEKTEDISIVRKLYEEAYEHFKKGLTIHDDLEKVYIDEMDFSKADKETENFIATLFQGVERKERDSTVYKRLFGTNTPDGITNHVENLINPLKQRVYIKGRAGTGKSVFMRKVLEMSTQYGLDVELYHCSFDPSSIDMLIIRDLNCCLFDSTPPHEFFPTRKSDVVIDLYEKAVNPGTDEKYATEIDSLNKAYKAEMKKGLKKLKETKRFVAAQDESLSHLEEKKINKVIESIVSDK